jgi:septal ring factor EnvC (AmiA/AmiB activator)
MPWFNAVIYIVLLLFYTAPCFADVKDDLQGIKKEISEKKLLLKKTKKVESKVSGELEKIQKNLRDKEASLNSLGRDLKGVESNLNRTQRNMELAKAGAELKKHQINLRLSALYKAGDAGNLRTFFSSDSFPQMTENLRYMRSVLDNDKQLFSEYKEKMDSLRLLKGSLEQDVARKEMIKSSIESKKQEIEQEKNKTSRYLLKVREDKKSYTTSLKELQLNARRLQSMVERLEARSRKGYTAKNSTKTLRGAEHALPLFPDKGLGAQKGRLTLPVKGSVVAQFGRHKLAEFNSYTVNNGISIEAPAGAQIHAVFDGQVIFADYFKGYGNMVIVDHGGGFFSLYAHAATIMKKVGATVARNDIVASVGDTDSSKGPMLYFEIRYQGKPVDPSPWFR